MDKEEAEKVLKILLTADGGCVHCVNDLFNFFIEDFLEYSELAGEIFKNKFGKEIDEVKKER